LPTHARPFVCAYKELAFCVWLGSTCPLFASQHRMLLLLIPRKA